MFKVINNKIFLVRGDTFRATVGMERNGEPYIPQEGDVVRFAMKRDYKDQTTLVSRVIPNDTLVLELEPEDTKSLGFGLYRYDIEITYANGDVDTFIRDALELLEEIE